jgi:hypothetical protein
MYCLKTETNKYWDPSKAETGSARVGQRRWRPEVGGVIDLCTDEDIQNGACRA